MFFQKELNYFLSAGFSLSTIYSILDIPEGEYSKFKYPISKESLGRSDHECLSHFEYYIIPKKTKKDFEINDLFDCQNKTFFQSNTKTTIIKGDNTLIEFGFTKDASYSHEKSYFYVSYENDRLEKRLVFVFDKNSLNYNNLKKNNVYKIPYSTYIISNSKIEKVPNPEFYLNLDTQSWINLGGRLDSDTESSFFDFIRK